MIFRTQLTIAVILFFQSIAFGSNYAEANDIEDTKNLRGSELPEQDERELRPYRFGQGFGFASNNNRLSIPRVAGYGSQRLRPYAPRPVEQREVPPPKNGKQEKGGKNEKAVTPKVGKTNDVVPKFGKGLKSAKLAPPAGPNNHNQPHRGGYLNSMNWQRVPGQPIFVSQTDLPTVLILDEAPTVVVDEQGNNILVDSDGNEIVIEEDDEGNLVVSVIIGSEGGSEPTPQPTSPSASFPLRSKNPSVPPTAKPTATPTLKPTAGPTNSPTKPPTRQPTINPTANPTTPPTKAPTKAPTKNPTKAPTAAPTLQPTAAR